MKSRIFSFLIAGSAILAACNNSQNGTSNAESATATPGANTQDSAGGSTATATADDAGLTQEKPTFTNVDSKTAASMNEVVTHYLHVKDALANDNGDEAANAAKGMVTALGNIDHASLAGEQMKLYMDVAESLKEHAEHTTENAKNIAHQREHFVMMSADVYDLVKGFGASQPLYVGHCPMANDNKGADWLSEKREINNPYMGQKMPKCGKVEKVIKQ